MKMPLLCAALLVMGSLANAADAPIGLGSASGKYFEPASASLAKNFDLAIVDGYAWWSTVRGLETLNVAFSDKPINKASLQGAYSGNETTGMYAQPGSVLIFGLHEKTCPMSLEIMDKINVRSFSGTLVACQGNKNIVLTINSQTRERIAAHLDSGGAPGVRSFDIEFDLPIAPAKMK